MIDTFAVKHNIRRRVLVVDDEMINRRILGKILSSDYDVLYAENGVRAMEQIEENIKTLSLIMLDLLMPQMDGYEVLKELQRKGLINRIPVIVLTSEKLAEVRSLELGAADFISKPYDMPEVIRARVRRSIDLAESYMMLNKTEHDSLTGLYSREFFNQHCDRLDSFKPDEETDAIVIDINKFRLINELHGRPFGDQVLKEAANVIISVASRLGGLAGRAGGDVFYLYVPHIEEIEPVVKEIEDHIKSKFPEMPIALRVGIYTKTEPGIELERRFDRAKAACGKKSSRLTTSVMYYDKTLSEKEMFEDRLTREMDDAIAQKQFTLYFQPKYNVTGDKPRLSSAEALVRWIHPELGFISPGSFIPLFESNGLINKLDRFVWNETAKMIAKLKNEYGKRVPISVNVSRVDIYDANLEKILLEIVSENGIEPKDLLLEITESAYTEDSSQIVDTVCKLRSDGFCIEMDDFGTGYSSLNMLSSLPIDALKLDMRFVRNICESEKDLRMVQLVIDLAKYLDVQTVAEGVETEQQYLLLKQCGCDVIQGYYFSRPVPGNEFEETVRSEE